MSTTVSTTKELSDNIIAQLETTLGQTIPFLPKSFLRVMSRAVAAVYILLYKYIGFGILQGFVSTASDKPTTINGIVITPLEEWGQLIGVGLPAPATRAQLLVEVVVETQTGTLSAGSQLIFPGTGVTYVTLSTVALDAATKQVAIQAVANQSGGDGSGEIGNLQAGQTVSFANPLPNVARDTTVLSTVVTGAEGESTAAYRQRIIDKFRARPQGGALTDYRIWGEEPAGILRVYPYRSGDCPGQVDVYVESATELDGIPTNAQLQEVLDSINYDEAGLASRRPVGALVQAFAINRTAFDVEVLAMVVDDAATVQAAITQGVSEYLLEREPFVDGVDFSPRYDRITQAAIGGIVDDIVSAAGGTFTNVVLLLNGVSIQTYSLVLGDKAKLGDVFFISN